MTAVRIDSRGMPSPHLRNKFPYLPRLPRDAPGARADRMYIIILENTLLDLNDFRLFHKISC